MSDPIHMFKVDDGETHWVVAKHPAHAVDLICNSHGIDRKEYLDAGDPTIEQCDPQRVILVHLDVAVNAPSWLPESSSIRVEARTTAQGWIEKGEYGIAVSSLY